MMAKDRLSTAAIRSAVYLGVGLNHPLIGSVNECQNMYVSAIVARKSTNFQNRGFFALNAGRNL